MADWMEDIVFSTVLLLSEPHHVLSPSSPSTMVNVGVVCTDVISDPEVSSDPPDVIQVILTTSAGYLGVYS